MCFSSIQLNGSLSIRWKSCGAKSRYIPKLKIKMIPREDEWKDGYRNCFLRLNHVRKDVLVGVESLRGIYFSIVPRIMRVQHAMIFWQHNYVRKDINCARASNTR